MEGQMIERIDEVVGSLKIGRMYLVPTVTGMWNGATKPWPVIGPQHNDRQCLDFENQHYHLDCRFLHTRSQDAFWWRHAFASPMQVNRTINQEGLPKPVWRPRKCRRLINPRLGDVHELAAKSERWQCHFDQWIGKQACHDGRGWVCPHRSVPLADQIAVNGVITCPLHLLRINAETGVVLRPLNRVEGPL